MRNKLFKILTNRTVLSTATFILWGINMLVDYASGKAAEEETKEIVREELSQVFDKFIAMNSEKTKWKEGMKTEEGKIYKF